MKITLKKPLTLLASLACLASMTVYAQGRPPFELPNDVASRKVDIYSEGVRMSGTVFVPKSATANSKMPCIVIGHGWGGTAAGAFSEAALFAQNGYFTLAFDYRGWGASDSRVILTQPAPATKKDNRFTAEVQEIREVVEPIAMATDWQNAIHWLYGESQCDTNRIGLWGTSFSGGLIAYVAARDHRVKAVFSQIGAFDGRPWGQTPEMYREATQRARGELGYPAPRVVFRYQHGGAERTLNGWPIASQFAEYAPVEEIKRMGDIPMMIVIAEHEELFDNADHGTKAFERHVGPNKQIVTLPGITHYGAYGPARPEAQRLALSWFGKYLKP